MTLDHIIVQCCICKQYEVTGNQREEDRVFKEMPGAVRLVLDQYDISHTYCPPCCQQERLKLKKNLNKPQQYQ